MTGTALILGITGSVGQATARALQQHGWQLRALHRDPDAAGRRLSGLDDIDWRRGDAMSAADITAAIEGCDLVLHAVNPPGYRNWRGLALPMLSNSIAAAKASGATLMLPGNVYNFGEDAWPVVKEDAPQHPISRKGQVRVEMEALLEDAARDGCRSIVLRAGDFFGPGAGSSWFDNVLVKPGRRVRSVTYPGRHDAGHCWAYLPDLAETFARLAERRNELPAFARFHFGGHYLERGVEMADAIRRVAGEPRASIKAFPWWMIRALGPFNELFRELVEMRYLWDNSLKLDNTGLVAFLGEEPHTPLYQALEQTLAALDCLPERRPKAA